MELELPEEAPELTKIELHQPAIANDNKRPEESNVSLLNTEPIRLRRPSNSSHNGDLNSRLDSMMGVIPGIAGDAVRALPDHRNGVCKQRRILGVCCTCSFEGKILQHLGISDEVGQWGTGGR